MTTVRIAHTEPWPGQRMGGHGFRIFSFLVVRSPVRIGYALAMAAATGAPVRLADQLMDQLAVPAQDDLVDQFTRDVPLPRRRRGWLRRFRGHPQVRLATR
jgi:hypothetical protein